LASNRTGANDQLGP